MFKKLIVGSLLMSVFLTACNRGEEFSMLPEEIVAQAIKANESMDSYYIETKMLIYEDDELFEDMHMKQWISFQGGIGRIRVEVISRDGDKAISTNNGREIITYDEKENVAYLMTFEENMVDLLGTTFQEQTKNTLEQLKKTHNIEILGEEKIGGVKAYHLKGTPKKEESINGEQEMWIDEESWLVVKTISHGVGHKSETEVLKLDTSPEIDDSIFTQEIPEGAEIVDTNEGMLEEQILTMDELVKEMNRPILYLPELSGYELRQVKLHRFTLEDMEDEVTQEYFKEGKHKFTFYNIKEKVDMSERELMPGEKEIEVRGRKTYVLDDFIRTISFSEDGMHYTVNIQDDDMKIEEAIELIEKMEFYN